MPAEVKVGGSWKTVEPDGLFVKVGGVWKNVLTGSVKVSGTWRVFHQMSDPVTDTFDLYDWSQVYKGTAGTTSTRPNNDDLSYFGWGWNSEIERTMLGMSSGERNGFKDQITTRPVVSSMRLHVWVGHVYAGTDTVYVGFHEQTTKPSTFSRFHTENDGTYSFTIAVPKPGSGAGAADWTTVTSDDQAIADKFQDETFKGITLTNEAATSNATWGWLSGSQYSTGNSGGSPSGLTNVTSSSSQRTRIEVTSDYV